MAAARALQRFMLVTLLVLSGWEPTQLFAAPPAGVVAKSSPVVQLAWMPDSQSLITTGKFRGLGEWMFTVGDGNRLIATDLYRLTQMPSFANSLAVGGKPGLVVVGSNVGTVTVHDGKSFSPIRTYKVGPEYSVYAVAVDPAGKHVAGCRTDGTVLVWNIDQQAPTRHLQQTSREGERMAAMAFSPDGKALATLSRYGFLTVWNLADGSRIGNVVQGAGGEGNAMQFTPDGERLIVISRAAIRLWQPTKEPQQRVVVPPDEVCPRYSQDELSRPGSRPDFGNNIRFAGVSALFADANFVASVLESGGIAIWDLNQLKVVKKLPPPVLPVNYDRLGHAFAHIAVAPSGKKIGASTTVGDLVVWEVEPSP